MKTVFVFFLLLISSICCFCQSKNSLFLQYGTASNNVNTYNRIGGPNYYGKGESIFGLKYLRKLTNNFAIETGLDFSVNKIQETSEPFPSRPQIIINGKIKMLSVPVYANYTFFKYLFVNVGITTDFETGREGTTDLINQSGIGVGLGIGGKYDFKRVTVFVNPFLHNYAIIPFNSLNREKILEAGFKFGIGYRF